MKVTVTSVNVTDDVTEGHLKVKRSGGSLISGYILLLLLYLHKDRNRWIFNPFRVLNSEITERNQIVYYMYSTSNKDILKI